MADNIKTFSYDLEVYYNFFSATFKSLDGKEKIVFYSYFWDGYIESEEREGRVEMNQFAKLVAFLQKPMYLMGYNNFNYDGLILNFIVLKLFKYDTTKLLLIAIKEFSDYIISLENTHYDPQVRLVRYHKVPYNQIDLMRIFALDKIRKSLKQTAINIKYHKIEDLPINPHDDIKPEQIEGMLTYNENDVDMVIAIYNKHIEEVHLRFQVGVEYNVNVYNSSRASVGDILFANFYSQYTGLEYRDFKDRKTIYKNIKLNECILDKVKFRTKFFNDFLDKLRKKVIVDTHNELKFDLIHDEVKYKMGSGGLHSDDKPKVFRTTDTHIIRDVDVNKLASQPC